MAYWGCGTTASCIGGAANCTGGAAGRADCGCGTRAGGAPATCGTMPTGTTACDGGGYSVRVTTSCRPGTAKSLGTTNGIERGGARDEALVGPEHLLLNHGRAPAAAGQLGV